MCFVLHLYLYLLTHIDNVLHCLALPATFSLVSCSLAQTSMENKHFVIYHQCIFEGLCSVLNILFENRPCFDALNNIVSHFIYIESIGYYG